VTALSSCRSCGTSGLIQVLDLGRTPLANALLTREQLGLPEPTYPLALAFCPNCTLVQLTHAVPPEHLFREYVYFSSYSDTMVAHAGVLAERLSAERKLGPNSLVLEIASNDGYLLQHYRGAGIQVLGIEPARNIARVAEERGIRTRCEFFTRGLATELAGQGTRADVIHAHNVLAHVPDLNGFVAGLRTLLRPDGVVILEVPHVTELIDRCEFDTIYHEHLSYFSLTALDRLFQRHELRIVNVERLPIHGGSLRLIVVHEHGTAPRPAVAALLAWEEDWGAARASRYRDFAARIATVVAQLRQMLLALKQQGKRIAAYGAAAKGTTLLHALDLPRGTLAFVADRSQTKQGHFTPGTHLPIVPPEELVRQQPDYVLLLTWNFADEILTQQAEYRARGGKFIVPIPEVQIV
jgi:SAM-dependent methyltransferase